MDFQMIIQLSEIKILNSPSFMKKFQNQALDLYFPGIIVDFHYINYIFSVGKESLGNKPSSFCVSVLWRIKLTILPAWQILFLKRF